MERVSAVAMEPRIRHPVKRHAVYDTDSGRERVRKRQGQAEGRGAALYMEIRGRRRCNAMVAVATLECGLADVSWPLSDVFQIRPARPVWAAEGATHQRGLAAETEPIWQLPKAE